jgi:hypothetical protein
VNVAVWKSSVMVLVVLGPVGSGGGTQIREELVGKADAEHRRGRNTGNSNLLSILRYIVRTVVVKCAFVVRGGGR